MFQQPRHQGLRTARGEVSKRGWSYTNFVRANPAGARTMESLLQYSGFFAPSRLADRDVAIESGYALASLAAMAHDRILLGDSEDPPSLNTFLNNTAENSVDRSSSDVTGGGQLAGSTTVQRDAGHFRRWEQTAVFAERLRVALSTLAHVQIVVEKIAGQHGGERRRRQAITCLETLKALSRLLLLACTREMIIGGGKYVPGGARKQSARPRRLSRAQTCPGSPEIYTGKRSGVRLVVPPRARVLSAGNDVAAAAVGEAGATPVDGAYCCRRREGSGTCDDGKRTCDVCRLNGVEVSGGRQPCERGYSEDKCVVDRDTVHGSSGGVGRDYRQEHLWQGHGSDGDSDRGEEEPSISQVWLMVGEVMNILRPLVYSHACTLSGLRSWRPWLISLGMDALAYACTVRAGGGGIALLLPLAGHGDRDRVRVMGSGVASVEAVPVLPYLTDAQAAELRRRKMLWLLYLMRSPAFEMLTEPVSRSAAGVFEGVPLFSSLTTYALNMLLYVQRHHFYTSAS